MVGDGITELLRTMFLPQCKAENWRERGNAYSITLASELGANSRHLNNIDLDSYFAIHISLELLQWMGFLSFLGWLLVIEPLYRQCSYWFNVSMKQMTEIFVNSPFFTLLKLFTTDRCYLLVEGSNAIYHWAGMSHVSLLPTYNSEEN